jgi:hypothetical protein
VTSSGDVWLHPGNKAGGWGESRIVQSGWQGKTGIVDVGDFNGDGYRDLIALDQSGSLDLYPTDGQYGWKQQDVTQIASGWDPNVLLIAPGDFNGDGYRDLLTRDARGDLWLHKGDGKSKLAAPVKIGNGWSGFTAIFGAGDWDGDGKQDLIARTQSGDLMLYRGNGSGGWASSHPKIGNGWQGFTALSLIGDFDGDGANDLAARSSNGDLTLYRGNGSGGWASSHPQIGTGWNDKTKIIG